MRRLSSLTFLVGDFASHTAIREAETLLLPKRREMGWRYREEAPPPPRMAPVPSGMHFDHPQDALLLIKGYLADLLVETSMVCSYSSVPRDGGVATAAAVDPKMAATLGLMWWDASESAVSHALATRLGRDTRARRGAPHFRLPWKLRTQGGSGVAIEPTFLSALSTVDRVHSKKGPYSLCFGAILN